MVSRDILSLQNITKRKIEFRTFFKLFLKISYDFVFAGSIKVLQAVLCSGSCALHYSLS